MIRGLSCLALTLLIGLAGCGKKPEVKDVKTGGETAPSPPETVAPGPAAKGDYVFFGHLNAKSIREGALYKELRQAIEKNGAAKMWDDAEGEGARELGFKPTDIDSATVLVAEVPPRGEPKVIVILASSKPVVKGVALVKSKAGPPDARGFYKANQALVHYPDDRTAVLLHPDLAQPYLNGYAKNRTAWPLSPELAQAASGHTAYAALHVQKLPMNDLPPRERQEFGSLVAAKSVTLTADLAGKSLKLNARGNFPDAATAGQASTKLRELHGMAVKGFEQLLSFAELDKMASLQPALQELQRGFREVKFETAGSDVVLSTAFTANFDMNKLVADAVKQIQETAPKIAAQNNLKQLSLALINCADTYNGIAPIHGARFGPNGMPRKPGDKPLLSWRVEILPYIEQVNLYQQFKLDEPWDSEHNKKLIPLMPKTFASPSKPGKPGETHYQMVVGPAALQPPTLKFPASFQDGTSQTIAIVEAADSVIWTKPDDVMFPAKDLPKDFRKKFGGQFPGGFHAAMWDGSVRFIKDSTSDRTLGFALNPADGNVLGKDW